MYMGGKKRKSVGTSIDEVDKAMYSSFKGAANSLSHLYTHAMNQQKLTFQAGETHGLEKLHQWILRQQEGGSRVNTADILSYLQNEIDSSGEDSTMLPRALPSIPHSQPTMNLANSGLAVSSGLFGVPSVGPDQQAKNNVFSNALSSPVRRSLQNYHIPQGVFYSNSVQLSSTAFRNNELNNSNDSSMDMHADSPEEDESTY